MVARALLGGFKGVASVFLGASRTFWVISKTFIGGFYCILGGSRVLLSCF